MTDTTNPDAACSPSGDPYLLTPGPLTTSLSVKQAMLHDFGSRDASLHRFECAYPRSPGGDRQW